LNPAEPQSENALRLFLLYFAQQTYGWGETLADQDSTPSIIVCALKRGPIMDTVLLFLISAGIVAFGVWVVAGTIVAGWPLASLMGLLAVIVGLLSLFGTAREVKTRHF
jgi:hypothetical protein